VAGYDESRVNDALSAQALVSWAGFSLSFFSFGAARVPCNAVDDDGAIFFF